MATTIHVVVFTSRAYILKEGYVLCCEFDKAILSLLPQPQTSPSISYLHSDLRGNLGTRLPCLLLLVIVLTVVARANEAISSCDWFCVFYNQYNPRYLPVSLYT